jgi:imidazolonepropionase-like amidohydrolase/Tol biopolymer transport system component
MRILFLSPHANASPPADDSPEPKPPEPKSGKEEPASKPPKVDWDVDAAPGATHDVALDLREGTWMSVAVSGDTLVFDLLGDLWKMPLAGGEATALTHGPAWDVEPAFSPDGTRIAYVSDKGGNEQLWTMNADGTGAKQFTHEEVARVTEPVWDPSGPYLFGRRRTVDTRSIGVTEVWAYHLDGGSGIPLTSKDDRPHAGEVTALDPRYLYLSSRLGRFEYNHNAVGGLWEIHRLNRSTGEFSTVVYGPGSSARPMVSPDGKTLVFISRDRTKTLLEAMDVASGKRRVVADWLSPDELEAFAMHGTYPQMAWTKTGDVVLWAQGKLWRLKLDGTRTEIPFHLSGKWTVHDVPRTQLPLVDTVKAKVIRWPTLSARGSIAFSALDELWVRGPDGKNARIGDGTGFSPAWSPTGDDLAWCSWSDEDGGALHVTAAKGGKTSTLPVEGQLLDPAWSADGNQLVVLRGVGGTVSEESTAQAAYEAILLTRGKGGWRDDGVITSIANPGAATRAPHLHLHDGRLWYSEDRPNEGGDARMPGPTALVSVKLDGTDKRTHIILPGSQEVAISPDFRWVAYKRSHELWLTAMPSLQVTARLVDGQLPSVQLTRIVGDWIGWTPDSKDITWIEGQNFAELPMSEDLFTPPPDDAPPPDPFADVPGVKTTAIELSVPRAKPTGGYALTHARVISMKGDEVLEDATVVVQGDKITAINGPIPPGVTSIDCTGKTIMPGMIDVHAHLHYDTSDVLPEQQWEYQTSLDFGVTTVHDPSASTDEVFTQAERVEAGLEKGPRVFSTGYILYGAAGNDATDTPTPDAAKAAVQRMMGYGAHSVKVYQQSQRERRQWYVQVCDAVGILCIPEGGGDTWQNLGMVVDGFQSVEHALPTAPLYADAKGLWEGSATGTTLGTFWTPTLLVAYGGLMGENWFYQHASPLDDPRLLKHWPARELDAKAWRRDIVAHDDDWRYQQTARDAEDMQKNGVHVTLGAHGQIQGIGAHWELWALAGPGAMAPHDALRAATIEGARYLGIDGWTGSIEPGKEADLVVLNSNPLDDIHHSEDIAFVLKNGEKWE